MVVFELTAMLCPFRMVITPSEDDGGVIAAFQLKPSNTSQLAGVDQLPDAVER